MKFKDKLQKLFDKSYSGVMSQKDLPEPETYYSLRQSNGGSCAIGHLISDSLVKKYAIGMDQTADSFSEELVSEVIGFSEEDCVSKGAHFLIRLQEGHDHAADYRGKKFRKLFKSEMKSIARGFKLTFKA